MQGIYRTPPNAAEPDERTRDGHESRVVSGFWNFLQTSQHHHHPPPLLLLPYLRTLDACFCLYHIHGHMQLPHAAYLHCISASHAEEFYRSFLSVSVGDVLGKGTNNKPHCDDPRTSPARLSKPADESIGEMHQACMSLSQA